MSRSSLYKKNLIKAKNGVFAFKAFNFTAEDLAPMKPASTVIIKPGGPQDYM